MFNMHAMIWEMPVQPFDPFEIGCAPVLHDQIAAHPQHVGGIEQRFFLGGDEMLLRRRAQSRLNADIIRQIIGSVARIGDARGGRRFVAEIVSSAK
jgi:hypothetical protein